MPKLLDQITVVAPCPVAWDSMKGTDTVRNCSDCAKNVYNLSAMTESEAEKFLQRTNGISECIQFFRRVDGKIMTENCPAFLRKIRNRTRYAASLIAGLTASLLVFFMGKSEASTVNSAPITKELFFGTKVDGTSLNGTLIGGMMGSSPKQTRRKVEDTPTQIHGSWHHRVYYEEKRRTAFKEYLKALKFKAQNQPDRASDHFRKSIALVSELPYFDLSIKKRLVQELDEVLAQSGKPPQSNP